MSKLVCESSLTEEARLSLEMLIGVLLSEAFRDMPPLFSFLSCAGDGHVYHGPRADVGQ